MARSTWPWVAFFGGTFAIFFAALRAARAATPQGRSGPALPTVLPSEVPPTTQPSTPRATSGPVYDNVRRNIRELAPTSNWLVAEVKVREGWRPDPYNDPVGKCTIGYGHLIAPRTCTSAMRQQWGTLTPSQGEKLLREDLAAFARAIQSSIRVPLRQQELEALISFAYNIGPSAFATSTLLKRLNAEQYVEAADEMLRWVYGTENGVKVKLPGLVKRREAERARFLALAPRA